MISRLGLEYFCFSIYACRSLACYYSAQEQSGLNCSRICFRGARGWQLARLESQARLAPCSCRRVRRFMVASHAARTATQRTSKCDWPTRFGQISYLGLIIRVNNIVDHRLGWPFYSCIFLLGLRPLSSRSWAGIWRLTHDD